MRLCILIVSVICVLMPCPASGQQAWEKLFGGPVQDWGYAVQQTLDGGYIVVGMTNSFGTGDFDAYAVKTDSFGTGMWAGVWGGTDGECANSVVQAADSGYVIAGYTGSFGPGNNDVWLIKTNGAGDTLWTKTFGGASRPDGANSVGRTAAGGYIVAGFTQSFGPGTPTYANVWLILTDGSGNAFWTRNYGGDANDIAYSVQQTFDGGFIVAGTTQSFGNGSQVYLIRTDADGDTLWTRTYGGSDYEEGNSVQQTSDSGYIIAGKTTSFGATLGDMYLVKTNAVGETLWTRTYGGDSAEVANSVQQTTDGGYVLAGQTNSYGKQYQVYVVKTDADGDTLWTRTFGGDSLDVGNAIQQTSDGGYIVAGVADPPDTRRVYDVYLVKMAPDSVTGIEGSHNPQAASYKLEPTIVSGVLNLGVDSRQNTGRNCWMRPGGRSLICTRVRMM